MTIEISVHPVKDRAELDRFVDLAYRLNRDDPNWVPPLRSEAIELLTPGKNPYFEHATVQLFLAWRGETPVGRISAHLDHLALEQPREQGMGPGCGHWGMLDAEDGEIAALLLDAAADWLRGQDMDRMMGPLSLSIWDEPGLLTDGHDHPPMIMMGHHRAELESWILAAGHRPTKQLFTYIIPVSGGFPKLIDRIVESGERSDKIVVRPIDMSRYAEEATLILSILNRAWSNNWGFVPLTDSEVGYVQKKLKPLIIPELNMIAEYEGEPVAFMLALPDVNEILKPLGGRLLPFGWVRLLYRIWRKRWQGARVPLMGVIPEYHNSRLASQLAFMMIEKIRAIGVSKYGIERAEVGWVLDDNQGMVALAEAIDGTINRRYTIYEKAL